MDTAEFIPQTESGAGWTGAQYSIYRVVLALVVGFAIASLAGSSLRSDVIGPQTMMLALMLTATLALALGWRDRWAAMLLIPLLLLGFSAESQRIQSGFPPIDALFVIPLLVFHIATSSAPFGSLDARGRVDPAGDWKRPLWIGHLAWGLFAIVYLLTGVVSSLAATDWAARSSVGLGMAALSWFGLALSLGFAIATFRMRWRPMLWLAMGVWRIGWITAFGLQPGDASLALLLVLACEPSAWWPGRSSHTSDAGGRSDGVARLYYDGDCGFCHHTVRFVLSEETATPEPLRLRFAPLTSQTFDERVLRMRGVDRNSLPDSIVVELEDGSILVRSAGAIEIASRLGGLWLALALVGRWIPDDFLDVGYDAIARIRKRLFATPEDSCPILPPELRARFEP